MPSRALILILTCLLQAVSGQASLRMGGTESDLNTCTRACCVQSGPAACCCCASDETPGTVPAEPPSSRPSGREAPAPAFCTAEATVFPSAGADDIPGTPAILAGRNLRMKEGHVPLTVLYCSFVH